MNFGVRELRVADVAELARCRAQDATARPTDPRMLAHFEGRHHPQMALAPRIGFVAQAGGEIVGYIAGHATERSAADRRALAPNDEDVQMSPSESVEV